ncbi:unnamed protein product [Lactuca saligna]|uniref:Uncharacterized protein n=1 Tax=Lactuca saligna TaxID=75948 RepID=A0AA35ZNK4_LACSI|nr:unnamed protein product [Lactuca saligna]
MLIYHRHHNQSFSSKYPISVDNLDHSAKSPILLLSPKYIPSPIAWYSSSIKLKVAGVVEIESSTARSPPPKGSGSPLCIRNRPQNSNVDLPIFRYSALHPIIGLQIYDFIVGVIVFGLMGTIVILFPQNGIKNLDIFFMCSPVHAAMAIEARVREIAIQDMKYFPEASQLQKYLRLMICNFVVMNTENRLMKMVV